MCPLQTPKLSIRPLDDMCIADTHTLYLATCCVHCRHPHFLSDHLTTCVLQTPTLFIWPLAVCIADIWDLKRFSYPWPTAEDTVLFRDFSVEDLQTAMRGTPVRHAVFVQVLNNSPEEAGACHCFVVCVFCFLCLCVRFALNPEPSVCLSVCLCLCLCLSVSLSLLQFFQPCLQTRL